MGTGRWTVWIIFTALVQPTAMAAGFALSEQSASGLGTAFAGAGSVAEDPSTIFYNPAGMTYLKGTQFSNVLNLIKPSARFHNGNTTGATGISTLGGEGGDLGSLALIPNFYIKHDLSDTIKLGLGVNTPFGLKTEYQKNWMGRFQAQTSDLKTVSLTPSLALRMSPKLSLGIGVSALYAKAELSRAVNYLNPLGVPSTFGEGAATIKGSDWGVGVNVGALYQLTPTTRLGLAYRSKIDLKLKGDVKFDYPSNALTTSPVLGPIILGQIQAAAPDGRVTAATTLPESLSFSTYTQLNEHLDVMTDMTWTRWSRFQSLDVYRTNGSLLSGTRENWHNSMRYALGLSYKVSPGFKLRTGIAYDNEAIPDQFRTARIPGNDRTWLSVGAGWQFSPDSTLDIGYAHLFVKDSNIDDDQSSTASGGNGRLNGSYKSHVDILSMQYSHQF